MSFHNMVWTPLFTKLLVASGGMACMLGVALYRRRLKQALLASSEVKVKEWESEKASLQKDKERLEQKLFELENILEKMSKEIESLKTSLKDKQKAVNAQETEKERLQEQERKVRRESEATIEQLQRRAQQFLRELEVKSVQCDSQSQHIALLEQSNQQMLQEKVQMAAGVAVDKSAEESSPAVKDKIYQQHQGLLQQHQVLLQQHQELRNQHDVIISQVQGLKGQVQQDIRYLLATFVCKQANFQCLSKTSEYPTMTPLIVGIESTQDPMLVSICKRYAVQLDSNGVADNMGWEGVSNGHRELGAGPGPIHAYHDSNDTLSFSVSVDGTKTDNPRPLVAT